MSAVCHCRRCKAEKSIEIRLLGAEDLAQVGGWGRVTELSGVCFQAVERRHQK